MKMNNTTINRNSKRFCSYKGCTSDRLTTNDGAITFFSFPQDTERCSKWITNCGREEFRYLTPHELKGKKICELHFAPCMFFNKLKTNLKKNAFPMNWKNGSPELIQIDDDDEDENVYYENYDVLDHSNQQSLGGNVDSIINDTDIQELSDGEVEHEQHTLNTNVMNSSTSTQTNTDNEISIIPARETHPVEEVPNVTDSGHHDERQSPSAVTSSTTAGNENLKTPTDKLSSKSNPTPIDKTKFHNLTSQTAQNEFYYQQCPSLAETNHSYPEPQDVEMPVFVQQNSVISLADDAANSEAFEPPTKKQKRDQEVVDLSAQMKDAMKYLKNITEMLTTSEDEFELFGKSVTTQLKKMSLCTALTVQAKIQQILSHYRIKDIKKKAQHDRKESEIKVDGSHENKSGARQEEKQQNPPQLSCNKKDSECVVNGVNEDNSEGEQEEDNLEQPNSPQLSLDCTSEASDIEGEQE